MADFYKEVFGREINTWCVGEPAYWLVTTGPEGTPGIDGGIMSREFDRVVINTLEVESLEATLKKIEEAGSRKVLGPNEIPRVRTHACCADIEGDLFGVLEPMAEEQQFRYSLVTYRISSGSWVWSRMIRSQNQAFWPVAGCRFQGET